VHLQGCLREYPLASNFGPPHSASLKYVREKHRLYPWITYYWTVPLSLDHSYLVGKLTSSKTADTKVSGF
jgi:hypothetical protein